MSVKQYIPVENQDPKEGDVTIVGGCGNGFLKVWFILFCLTFVSWEGVEDEMR